MFHNALIYDRGGSKEGILVCEQKAFLVSFKNTNGGTKLDSTLEKLIFKTLVYPNQE